MKACLSPSPAARAPRPGSHSSSFRPQAVRSPSPLAFTLIEILIAMGIFSLVLAAIYSTWTAILRASKVGVEAAAVVQRARIAISVLEESLGSVQSFAVHQQMHPEYYAFLAENGSEASLSFVSRLAKSFPRAGRFGDLDVRRLTFSVEPSPDSGRQLVLRQHPVIMSLDVDEKEHPLVLAKNVKEFLVEFWDTRQNDWVDEWTQSNTLPVMVKVTLTLSIPPASHSYHSSQPEEQIMRIVSLPSVAVAPSWQMARPTGPGVPGGPQPAVPGQTPVPGQPGIPGQPFTPQPAFPQPGSPRFR